MKIPVHIAEKLALLSEGKRLASSSVKHPIIEELISEKIIDRTGRIQKQLSIPSKTAFFSYLQNRYSINDLGQYISILQQQETLRGEAVKVSGNSKLKKVRTFKGFLVNCYLPIQVTINEKTTTLFPTAGKFDFIYDFEKFTIPQDIVVVGIENPENFRHIEKQKYLFENIKPLFVSRYPQNQSKDFMKWLQSIPNRYLHFGDFDFAGIAIYLYEYKKKLKNRATFFVPENIESLIEMYGERKLYNKQKNNFNLQSHGEMDLIRLTDAMHKHKKCLEQEIMLAIK